jgi:hypothetical protein
MNRKTIAAIALAALMVSVGPAAPSQEKPRDVWKPFQFFTGKWEGSGEGKPGVSRGTQEFSFVLGGHFLQVRNVSVLEPRGKNPKGEKHEDWGFFSYDSLRKAYVFRQFHVEGFFNQYVCAGPSRDGKTFVFLSETLENLPPGFQARLTYRILDQDSFEQTFDLAAPGQKMECYLKGVMVRPGSRPRPPAKEEKKKEEKKPVQASPPCDVHVSLNASSPFVPDGRMSLAEISFEATFQSVTFEFDPAEDPLLGRCQVNAAKGKTKFSRLFLNEAQRGDERLPVSFLSVRPSEFPAGLGIESEPTGEDEAAAKSGTAPEKVRLAFWTELGRTPVKWGSKFGTDNLPDLKVVFEVPFRDLIRGKGCSITLPYQGRYPEDSGTWQIEIRPGAKKK